MFPRRYAQFVAAFVALTVLACGSGQRKKKQRDRGPSADAPAAIPGAGKQRSKPEPKHKSSKPQGPKPKVSDGDVTIQVKPDGSFEPAQVTVHKGATVTWAFSDPFRQSIAPLAKGGDGCRDIAPYDASYADLTGPMPRNPSGLFILNQDGPGITKGSGGNFSKDGPLGAILDETWESDEYAGGFIRLRWNWIQPDGPGAYDWTVLDREVEKAVANGKLFSIGVKAGFHGTPEWIFDHGVEKLVFRDYGTHPGSDECKCGAFMALGNPTQDRYQELYFDMLDAMAKHLKSNAAWYRHLAYVKPSGANLYSAENRLPKRCDCASECSDTCAVPREWKGSPNLDASGRICNTEVWAKAGYTADGLYRFYDRQLDRLAKSYPEKDFAFLLIHDGFPQVGSRSNYLTCGEDPKRVRGAPEVVAQTRQILRRGWKRHQERFTLQHAGLRTGKPVNRMMRMEKQATQYLSLQSANEAHDTASLGPIVKHGIEEGAIFIEVYEEATLQGKPGVVGAYNEQLHKQRKKTAAGNGPRRDPFPEKHRFTFDDEATIQVVNPSTCATDDPAFATIYVVP